MPSRALPCSGNLDASLMPGDDTPLRVPETKQARVKDHELRVDFLDTVAEQPLNKPDVRAVTKGLLEKTGRYEGAH